MKERPSFTGIVVKSFLVPVVRKIVSKNIYNELNFKIFKVGKNLKFQTIEFINFKMDYMYSYNSTPKYAILQLHGGSYIYPLYDLYRISSTKFLRMYPNMAVVNPDYRIAPKNQFPDALYDVIEAYNWLLQRFDSKNIIISGDSAGGGLALSLLLYLKENKIPLPAGLIAMSPWTNLACNFKSFKNRADMDTMLGSIEARNELKNIPYAKLVDKKTNKYVSPVLGNYRKMPPMLIQVGECEVLYDDSKILFDKVSKYKKDIYLEEYKNMFHVFQLCSFIPEAKVAWNKVGQFIKSCFNTNK